jgi:hypothetical protein
MSRRKGELSKSGIDRGWPYQVAMPERLASREHWRAHHAFIQERGLTISPLGHRFLRDGQWWLVICFGSEGDARTFMDKFGGEYMTPQTRPRR